MQDVHSIDLAFPVTHLVMEILLRELICASSIVMFHCSYKLSSCLKCLTSAYILPRLRILARAEACDVPWQLAHIAQSVALIVSRAFHPSFLLLAEHKVRLQLPFPGEAAQIAS